jgi:hypothetical protein
VKSRILVLSIGSIIFSSIIFFSACKKINEGTRLGDDLLPAIDNVTTFQAFLDTKTDNKLLTDTTKLQYSDQVALGHITNDPEFGSTHADVYFNVSYGPNFSAPGTYPFVNKDSVSIDSVILSLSYQGGYGDTTSFQTVRVYEIAQNSVPAFNDTTLYKFGDPDFQITGPQLGFKTFQPSRLSDSIRHILKKDTTTIANVLRIPLDTQLGRRFVNYDTAFGATGAYRSDSIFKTLFRGLAIKSDNSGNVLTYYNLSDATKTKLTIYFKFTKGGVKDTTAIDFFHITDGQADLVRRTQGGNWASYLANGNPEDDKLYIQSIPGSYASIKIPALDTFQNAVIHRAELIITRIPSAQDNIFTPPLGLFLDKINNAGDTASVFDLDMGLQVATATTAGITATYDFVNFGGALRSDSTYRFNITRYVQHIVTNKDPNRTLRLSAPLRAVLYSETLKNKVSISFLKQVANGRVVLAGGNNTNPAVRVRLRLVYSKI